MRPCVSSLLLTLLLLTAAGSVAFAQQGRGRGAPNCGDGACESPFESCGLCPQDCGVCGKCGDKRCGKKETCRNCPEDCGACPVPEEESPSCGDAICESEENCSACPGDCGACPTAGASESLFAKWKRRLLQEGIARARRVARQARRFLLRISAGFEQDARARSEAARDLLQFLEEHPDVAERFPRLDRALTERVSRREGMTLLNIVPSLRVRAALRGSVRKESAHMAALTSAMLENAAVREHLAKVPKFAALVEAVEGRDLGETMRLLPPPGRSLAALTEELAFLRRIAEDDLSTSSPGEFSLRNTPVALAFAQGADPKTSKDSFKESVELMQQMGALTEKGDFASLEMRLAYLQDRRNVLAGVVNLSPKEVEARMREVEVAAGKPSTRSLIKVLGILRFVRASANFQDLEATIGSAATRMRSGLQNLRALFAFDVSPPAEAAALLEWAGTVNVHALRTEDVAAQKGAIRGMLASQQADVQEPLAQLLPEERRGYEAALERWDVSILETAESPTDLRRAMLERYILITNLQQASEGRRNVVVRFLHTLRSAFART